MIGVGDFVLCKGKEVGRVAEVVDEKHLRVCYHTGYTSAYTAVEFLKKVTPEEAQTYSKRLFGYDIYKLGGGRFDQ